MSADTWVRRAAMATLPALALAIWLSRRPAPASHAAPTVSPPTPTEPAQQPTAPVLGGEKALAFRDALAAPHETGPTPAATDPEPPARPAPAARAAVDLPLAGNPPTLAMPHRHSAHRHREHAAEHASLCGGLEVRLITASDDPAWSFASIASGPDDPARIRRIGDTVGSWRVSAIDWDRVWVQAGGARCAVGMHVGAREAEEATSKNGTQMLAPADAAPEWRLPQEIASAIDKQSETELEISKSALDSIYARGADLLSGVRIKPAKRDDKVIGMEVADLPADSLLDVLGVERGDVVLALADTPCTSLDNAIAALGRARGEDELVARLERHGEAFDLSLRVVTR